MLSHLVVTMLRGVWEAPDLCRRRGGLPYLESLLGLGGLPYLESLLGLETL